MTESCGCAVWGLNSPIVSDHIKRHLFAMAPVQTRFPQEDWRAVVLSAVQGGCLEVEAGRWIPRGNGGNKWPQRRSSASSRELQGRHLLKFRMPEDPMLGSHEKRPLA